MKAVSDQKTALLITDDPALERVARNVAKTMGDLLQLSRDSADATCQAFDVCAQESFAILDVDALFGTRSMLNTVAGLVPVIAVTSGSKPWLDAMLRHHRIQAAVSKPVSAEALREIIGRLPALAPGG